MLSIGGVYTQGASGLDAGSQIPLADVWPLYHTGAKSYHSRATPQGNDLNSLTDSQA